MKKFTLTIATIFIIINCYSQTNMLSVAPKMKLSVDIISYFEVGKSIVKTPPLTWAGCMSNAMKACKTSSVCSFGYALTPAAYMLGWALGCAIYSDVKPIEDLSKEVINKIK